MAKSSFETFWVARSTLDSQQQGRRAKFQLFFKSIISAEEEEGEVKDKRGIWIGTEIL